MRFARRNETLKGNAVQNMAMAGRESIASQGEVASVLGHEMISMRRIVSSFFATCRHQGTGNPVWFRIDVCESAEGFSALIFLMENFSVELGMPIRETESEGAVVTADILIYDDFLTNDPTPIIATSESEVLDKVSSRLRGEGYVECVV